jgi:hypothetical protein
MEIFGFHPELGKWTELGNSGMFRPEMLRPMGLPEGVRVIAWGLSLERPTMIKYKMKVTMRPKPYFKQSRPNVPVFQMTTRPSYLRLVLTPISPPSPPKHAFTRHQNIRDLFGHKADLTAQSQAPIARYF